jgi:hypothetical protein
LFDVTRRFCSWNYTRLLTIGCHYSGRFVTTILFLKKMTRSGDYDWVEPFEYQSSALFDTIQKGPTINPTLSH